MRVPYVIDNQDHVLADVLKAALAEHEGKSLDVATAFFSIRGFEVLREGLDGLGSLRLLLGAEPRQGEQLGLGPLRKRFGCGEEGHPAASRPRRRRVGIPTLGPGQRSGEIASSLRSSQ